MWEINGNKYSTQELQKAAEQYGLSFEDYLAKMRDKGLKEVFQKAPQEDKVNIDNLLTDMQIQEAIQGKQDEDVFEFNKDPIEFNKKYKERLLPQAVQDATVVAQPPIIDPKEDIKRAEAKEFDAIAKRAFQKTRNKNEDLFIVPGDETSDDYYGKVLDYKNEESIEKFNKDLFEEFVLNDDVIQKQLIPATLEKNKDLLEKIKNNLRKEYNLEDIDRVDIQEDIDLATAELKKRIASLISSDADIQKRIQKFNLAYSNIAEDQYNQGILGTELAKNDADGWIRGSKLLQSIYGGFRSIGTSMKDVDLQLNANYRYRPLELNNKKHQALSDDAKGFMVVGKNMKNEYSQFYPGDTYQLGMPPISQLKEVTWGEAKKVQEEKLKEYNKEATNKVIKILDREVVDASFDRGSFLKIFEEGGDNPFMEVGKLVGTQVPQLLQVALTLGAAPVIQASGDMYVERVIKKVKEKNNFTDEFFNDPANRPIVAKAIANYNSSKEAQEDSDKASVLAIPYGAAELVGALTIFKGAGSVLKGVTGSLARGQVKNVLKKGWVNTKDSLKASVAESITETIQTGIEDIAREEFSGFEQYVEAAGAGGTVGFFLPISGAVINQTSTELANGAKIAAGKFNPNSTEAFFNSKLSELENAFKNKQLTEQEYNEKREALIEVRDANFKVPKNIRDQRGRALDLILEKNQIQKRLKENDDAFNADDNIRLAEINTELAQIAALNKVRDVTSKAGKAIAGADLDINYIVAKDANEAKDKAGKNSIQLDGNATGYISADGKTIIIDEQKAAQLGEVFTAQHEVLHAALFNTLYNLDKEGNITGKNVVRGLAEAIKTKLDTLDTSKPTNNQGKKDFYKRLDLYKSDPNATRAEEVLTLFSDALAFGDIKFQEGTLTKIKDAVRRVLQDVGFAKIKFNTEQDVYNFIKDYNKSIAKGRFTRAQRTAIKEGVEVGAGIRRFQGKENVAQISKKNRAEINNTYTAETTNDQWKNGGVADNAITKLYGDGENGILAKIARGNITQSMLTLPGFSREDFISEVTAALIPHIRNFKPEQAAKEGSKINLAGWINGFVKQKADGVLGKKTATKEQFEEDVTSTEGAKQIADEGFDLQQEIKNEIDNTYQTLLESKIFDNNVINSIKDKLKLQITTLNNSIYEAVSKNKTVTPFVSEIRKGIMKQADIDIRKAMGGLKGDEFKNFLTKNKKAILENMTLSFLSRFAPQTVEKQVNGEFISDWQGKKIDRASAKETGMTSGPQIMRRKDNVENSITDEQWLNIFIKNDKIVAAKKESLAQQIAAELGLDIFRDDLMTKGPLTEALNNNAEIRGVALQDNYVAEIGRQLDRGNTKMNKVLKSRISDQYINNGNQFIKDFNNIAKVVYATNDTIEDFVVDDVWNHKALKKYPVEFIEHFRELEQKGAYAATGFKAAMFRHGVPKNIIDNYLYQDIDKDALHKDNIVIAKSPIGRIIYKLYKNKNNDNVSSEIAMLLYIKRFLDPAASKRDGSQGAYRQERNDIEQLLKNNTQALPENVELALDNIQAYNSQTGRMFDIMKDIYSVSGKQAQLAKLKEYQDEIQSINDANTIVLKHIIKELRTLIQQGKIKTNNALAILQGQSNAALGIKSLTTWNYLTVDGKQRTTQELKAKGTRLYGEHLKVNVDTMGEIANVLTTAEDVDVDNFVDSKLNEYTQLATFAEITGPLDNDLGRTNFTTSVDRINNLSQSDINNIYSTTGIPFRIHRSDQVANNTANELIFKNNKSLNKARIYDQAVDQVNKINKERKGITILDFDDTIAISDSKVIVNMPDGKVEKITPAEFAEKSAELEARGAKFDFKEFNQVIRGRKGPLFDLALKRQAKFGNKDIFILTARPQASAQAIQQFAKGLGLNLKLENITGLENGTAQAKANWVIGKAAEGYNDFYFADDAYKNVKAVQDALSVIDVKSDIQQAKMNKSLNKRFNQILEETKGVKAEAVFSDAAAKARGAFKGRWNIFIEPSAEDFAGLLYQFMGKGRQGEQHKQFFEDNLLRPLARGVNALNAAKQSLRRDYEALKKLHPEVNKTLKQDSGYNMFTNDVAVRVYMWNKTGQTVPGLSKADTKALVKIVNSNPDMKAYADKLLKITKLKEGWPTPDADWLGSSIGLDLSEINQTLKRDDYFREFNDNVDIILSPENMNKIEAIYGSNFREALEDILYRVQKGTNRNFGNNRLVNNFMNWINSATGTIMFLNTRSAVLQTISFTNFINYSDNNILAAAKAFSNQKQFWSDFGTIFNSDFLKQRRGGLQQDVNWQEIADAVKGSRNPVRRAISLLLEKGFLPTQIADSFAIALGGSSMLRNRINTYTKQGMSKKEAEQKAFVDMQEVAETTQQSGRPDVISQEQASPLGRVILAFQNVTMQYNRRSKKEILDLLNNRRVKDPTTGEMYSPAKSRIIQLSRVAYYMGMQNLVFHSMQQALFAMLFDDEDDEKTQERYAGVTNGMADSILRGMGIKGAIVATLKNMVLKFQKENEKPGGRADYAYVLIEGINVSPPLGSKARKTYAAFQTYKFNKKEILDKSLLDPSSPIIESYANVISAATNIPTDRVYHKVESLNQILQSETEAWQRIALALGWRDWQLNIQDDNTTSGKAKNKDKISTSRRKRLN